MKLAHPCIALNVLNVSIIAMVAPNAQLVMVSTRQVNVPYALRYTQTVIYALLTIPVVLNALPHMD